ncbi:MAG: hypothetical protein QW618_03195 [Nitrososphaerales archaeon]
MTYLYKLTWDWEVQKILPLEDFEKFIEELNNNLVINLEANELKVERIESGIIDIEIIPVNMATGYIYRGQTIAIFESKEKPTSIPIIILAVITAVLPSIMYMLIALFGLLTMKEISKTIEYIGEKAPEAIPLAIGLGGGIVLLLLVYLMLKTFKKEVK